MKHILAPVALLAARATIPATDAGDDAKGCASGLYMISVRGTGEEQGIGVAGTLLGKKVAEQVKGSKIVGLQYPATLASPPYPESVGNGTKNLTELLEDYHKSCPDGKIAILGYSQGAQVSLDTLCGTDETGFTTTDAISSSAVDNGMFIQHSSCGQLLIVGLGQLSLLLCLVTLPTLPMSLMIEALAKRTG